MKSQKVGSSSIAEEATGRGKTTSPGCCTWCLLKILSSISTTDKSSWCTPCKGLISWWESTQKPFHPLLIQKYSDLFDIDCLPELIPDKLYGNWGEIAAWHFKKMSLCHQLYNSITLVPMLLQIPQQSSEHHLPYPTRHEPLIITARVFTEPV